VVVKAYHHIQGIQNNVHAPGVLGQLAGQEVRIEQPVFIVWIVGSVKTKDMRIGWKALHGFVHALVIMITSAFANPPPVASVDRPRERGRIGTGASPLAEDNDL